MQFRAFWLAILTTALCLTSAGLSYGAEATDKKENENPRFRYPVVGDNTVVDGMLPAKVEGIGLVIGLKGTGSDPPMNDYRKQMIELMQKKDIFKPTELLSSSTTSIVLLRAYIPPGARKGEKIDVEVFVPPGDSTTSLAGGRLLDSGLAETMIGKGRYNLKGDEVVKVQGPVLVWPNASGRDDVSLKKGALLGGGTVEIDRTFQLVLNSKERSGRRTKLLAERINERFYTHEDGKRVGLAKAVDDRVIDLKLAKEYRYDIARYLLVVRRIPPSLSENFRERLKNNLSDELNKPESSIEAALRLEALGKTAVPQLQEGLKNSSELVRFASAQSLAYLGDGAGINELTRLAETSSLYRSHALSAMVALNHPVSRIKMGSLLHCNSVETRYGAFRALWAFDNQDPLVRCEEPGNGIYLHAIESPESPPLVHVSRRRRQEIIVFNRDQEFKLPLSLRAGEFVMINSSAENDKVYLASFRPGPNGTVRNRVECSTKVVDVIREAAKMGADYPELVAMIQQAEANDNLPGRFAMNAMPKSYRFEEIVRVASGKELDGNRDAKNAEGSSLFQEEKQDKETARSKRSAPKSDVAREKTAGPVIGADDDEVEKAGISAKSTAAEPKKQWWNVFGRSAN